MHEQTSLFDPDDPIEAAFRDFHRRHPEVEEYMSGLAFYLFHKGRKRYGVRSLWERCRWHFQVEKDMGAEFKLNDHYHSRYARLIMQKHPELDGFFELRRLKNEREAKDDPEGEN